MTRVYGGCIEPEGCELADERGTATCPGCGAVARTWHIERAEGSLNVYSGLACDACGYTRGDCPDDCPGLMPEAFWDLPDMADDLPMGDAAD